MNQAEYETLEQAQVAFKSLKDLTGQRVKQKGDAQEFVVDSVLIHPYTWFNDGIEEIKGYDVRIILENSSFFIKSKDLQAWYKL